MKEKLGDVLIKKYGNQEVDKILQMTLTTSEVQVWILSWIKLESWIRYNWKTMSLSERTYVERFVHDEDRMRSAAGKIVTRKLVAHYKNNREDQVEIVKGKYGKPIVKDTKTDPIYFNVSHSEEIVMIAIARGRMVGIDVEKLRPMPDYLSLAQNFFAPSEWKIIEKAKDQSLFYDYWTAKEAYLKAIGTGLNKELNLFEMNGNDIIDCEKQLKKWKRKRIDVWEGYVANIVYEENRG